MDNYNQADLQCSVVVPLYNEASTLEELYGRLSATLRQTGLSYEIILVDDGSTDGTLPVMKDVAEKDSTVIAVELRRNFGQTAALAAGFDTAKGQIIISMDGDLQHLPEEIPCFVAKIGEGYDVVSGWRRSRVDNVLTRKIPSRIANWLAWKISGVEIHDFGTTFKAYRREVIENLNLYGQMHRFIPALLSQMGVKIAEIPIENVARPKGTSNYGLSRTFAVLWDLITLRFLLGYVSQPLHFFGRAALYCILLAAGLGCYILYDKFVNKVPIMVAHGPMAGFAAVLLLTGLIFISTGLIGEMISRVYFECTGKKIYAIRRTYHRKEIDESRR